MSIKNKKQTTSQRSGRSSISLSAIDGLLNSPEQKGIGGYFKKHWIKGAVCVFILLFAIGVLAKKGWLPHTDGLSGKKTGWFGAELPKNASSTWNPFVAPPPSTPQLSKEYIYAGSKLLAVADANANTAPPADLALWRPSSGEWFIFNGDSEAEPSAWWGQAGDIPVQGDYDGDGKTDFSVVRPTQVPVIWWITNSSDSSITQVYFGNPEDIPVAADYDGDGKTDVAVWRPSDQHWYIRPSAAPSPMIEKHLNGTNSDKPAPADFDGDGKADIAVWRSSQQKFLYQNSSDGQDQQPVSMGSTGTPVCADYDGDGKADFALLIGNVWKIKSSITNEFSNTPWYYAGDTPVPNDYDGDGMVDIAVWHFTSGPTATTEAFWCIRQSSDPSTPRINVFGTYGDIPVPANYRR